MLYSYKKSQERQFSQSRHSPVKAYFQNFLFIVSTKQ